MGKPFMKFNPLILSGLCLVSACHPPEKGSVRVTGHSTMKVLPDMVELSLKASTVRPAMKDAVLETQAVVNQILAVCHKYIHGEEDIKVSIIATNKDYSYQGNHEVFDGYSAQVTLEVRLRDLGKLEPFTEELLATRINSIENIRYNHSKADSIQRVVNLLALADAQKTAQKMCEQMNVRLGKIVYLANYQPGQMPPGGMEQEGGEYSMNVYNKMLTVPSFRMTSQILEFRDAAFAGFEIGQ